ncbi:ECF transporter S component [Candidatus Woesearchaeota archaeon]|nr:ECF transporter S component [Candidatus Woesearchaeota archaeon]
MAQKLKLVSKKKKEQEQKQKEKLSTSQKVALHAMQKQMQLLKLKEWLVVMGFVAGGVALRVPMQAVPSAEPITFFAILAGWLFGKKKGFITGAAAGYISNFLMIGGQGPWTIFQVIGWGLAGFLGGFIGRIKPKKSYFAYWLKAIIPVMLVAVSATLVFEVIMNVSWASFFPYGIFTLMLSSLPFTLIHLVSNVSFSLLLPFARKVVHEKGKFDEAEVCREVIGRINGKLDPGRVLPPAKTGEQ